MESFDFKGLDCNGGPLSGSIMEKIIHISKQLPQESEVKKDFKSLIDEFIDIIFEMKKIPSNEEKICTDSEELSFDDNNVAEVNKEIPINSIYKLFEENQDLKNLKHICKHIVVCNTEDLTISTTTSTESIDQENNSSYNKQVFVTAENVIEDMNRANEIGIQQKKNIERFIKLEKMSLLNSANYNITDNMLTMKSKKHLFKKLKNKDLTVPRIFRITNNEIALKELERMFLLSKHFIKTPKSKVLEELKTLKPQLRDRISSYKESLSHSIDLSSCELTSIPLNLVYSFRGAKSLDLSNNSLKSIPDVIKRFQNLDELILSCNKISTISPSLFALEYIQILKLNNNRLSTLPVEISCLENLFILDVSENHISEIPKHIGLLKNLKQLYVGHNPLIRLPNEMCCITTLQILEASYCSLKKFPKDFCCLVDLEFIDLSHNQIKEIPLNIGLLKRLKEFNLSYNQISEIPLTIGLCEFLSDGGLDLSNNPLSRSYDSPNDPVNLFEQLVKRMHKNATSIGKIPQVSSPKPPVPVMKPQLNIKEKDIDNKFNIMANALYHWCINSSENYINFCISKLESALDGIEDAKDPLLSSIIDVALKVRTLTKKNEDFLPIIDQESINFDKNNDLELVKSIVKYEINQLKTMLEKCIKLLKRLSQKGTEKDANQIVHIVHYIRDILITFLLD